MMKKIFSSFVSLAIYSICFGQKADTAICPIIFPKAITIGSNDFCIKSNCKINAIKIEIYNRWGVKVFNAEILDKLNCFNWDNTKCKKGAYYYIVKYNAINKNGESIDKKLNGYIELQD